MFTKINDLVILCMNLEIGFRVIAGGADLRSFCANHNVTAVAALPYLYRALLEHFGSFHILKKCAVALLVVLFHLGYR